MVKPLFGFPLGNSSVNAWSESLSLENFPDFNFATSCHMMEMDPDNHKNLWKLCLIGYVAGKFLGFTALNKFIVSSSKCNVKLTMHDSSWLVFTFSSKVDKLVVLNGGLYSIFGRPLILKTMPEYFDFTASDMTRVPIWVRFPNLPLKCWSPTCLSKIASVIGKPSHCASMSRPSYAKVLIKVDLLIDLFNSINLIFPNGMPLLQMVTYESLPRFCKLCQVLSRTASTCTKVVVISVRNTPRQLLNLLIKTLGVLVLLLKLFLWNNSRHIVASPMVSHVWIQ